MTMRTILVESAPDGELSTAAGSTMASEIYKQVRAQGGHSEAMLVMIGLASYSIAALVLHFGEAGARGILNSLLKGAANSISETAAPADTQVH